MLDKILNVIVIITMIVGVIFLIIAFTAPLRMSLYAR